MPRAEATRTVVIGRIRTMTAGGEGTARAMLLDGGRIVALSNDPAGIATDGATVSMFNLRAASATSQAWTVKFPVNPWR